MDRDPGDYFVIKRSLKFLATTAFFGLVIAAFGLCFLYCNRIAPDLFCKWCGIISTVTGALMIVWPALRVSSPLLKADRKGMWFDIAVSDYGVSIPWDGITDIREEAFGRFKKSTTPCLVFDISEDYVRKIPALLKSAYYRENNRLYFASGILSVPVEEALRELQAIRKNSFA